MANQKEYKIIINGISESIEGVSTLQNSLDKLGKTVQDSGGQLKTAAKGMDELAKTNKQIAEYNEEYATALAANKAVLADHNKEVKAKIDLEKAELTVQADLRETYAQKQQLLTAMGKVIKNTAGDTTELQAKYAALNQELKDFDATLGNHQRSVGNYEIATNNLKGELKDLTAQMAAMLANGVDKADPKFVELAQRAGQLKDAIGDAGEEINRFASDTKKLDDVINVAQSATAAFELYKGAMSAFGLETEGAVEAIQKLQGAMSIIQSLQTLQKTLEQNSATANLFSKAMKMLGLSMDGATKSTKLLKIGLASIGIGLIIGLVATLITNWEDLVGWFGKTFPFLNNLQQKFVGLGKAIVNWVTNPIVTLGKVLKKIFSGDFSGALEEAKNGIIKQFKGTLEEYSKGYQEAMTEKTIKEENKRSEYELKMLQAKAGAEAKYSKEGIELQKKVFEQRKKLAKGNEEELKQIALDEANFTRECEEYKTKQAKKGAKTAEKLTKEEKEIREKMLNDLIKYEEKAAADIKKLRDKEVEEEKKRQEKLKSLRKKGADLEYDYQKALLNNQLAEAKNDEEKIKIKKKLIELDKKRQEEAAKAAAADALGISMEELNKRLSATDEKWIGLNETEKEVLKNLQTQLETIKVAADTANKSLNGDSGGSGDKKENDKNNWFSNEYAQASIALAQETFDTIADAFQTLMDFEIEEAEEALDKAEEMHNEQVDKIEESKDRIKSINDEMKESSGAQLEAYKQQLAEESLLMSEREQEERRLQKEKEKREKELEKKQRQQRKQEAAVQLAQAIINTGLSVTKAFSQWGWPLGAVFGAILSALGTAQVALISKQMSKMADGGLLVGRSHSQGGIPVGNTGIEVEGGEAVINKRSTAKYLPLLDAINADGNGGKHTLVGSRLSKYADGGQLNYQRISGNLESANTAKVLTNAIESINFTPTVSVVDINRGQKNLVQVKELAGSN